MHELAPLTTLVSKVKLLPLGSALWIGKTEAPKRERGSQKLVGVKLSGIKFDRPRLNKRR